MDQQNFAAERPVSADPAVALAKALGQWPKPMSPKDRLAGPLAAKTSVEDLARRLREDSGFLLDRSQFTVFGRCRDCAGGMNDPAGSADH